MRAATPILALLWAASVFAGGLEVYRHQFAPGASADQPPAHLKNRSDLRPRLLMFLHPQCPCSRATIRELGKILTAAKGALMVEAYFYRPSSRPAAWVESALWQEAAQLPNVELQQDIDGRVATSYGAHTSGLALLYSPTGALVFSGGITDSRGHEGDNDGEQAIIAYVRNGRSPLESTPVFGCVIR